MHRLTRNCITSAVVLFGIATMANAQTVYYWDSNGVTAGAGVTPTGTWGTSAFWSTSSAGTSATTNATTTLLDTLAFSAGTTATGSYAITVNGTQNANQLVIQEGTVTFSGGTIILGKSSMSGITLATGAGNATISSNLTITGKEFFSIGSGRTLALNTGTFTRAAGAILDLGGVVGTVTSTMTGLSTNNAAGMIGTWASFGSFATLKYATFSGSTITGLTGTAAANAAAVTDTTGLANYDLAAATGSMQPIVSANTIRYTGATGTTTLGATSFTVNGLMIASASSSTVWTLSSNTLTIGANRELVVQLGNGSIEIASSIRDNGGGASALTVTGSSTLSLTGANTYTGVTTISGQVVLGRIGGSSTGSLSPSSAIVNNGFLYFARSNTITQGIDFGVISGLGGVGFLHGTTVLNGANTYAGQTYLDTGTLSVATIGNGGVASPIGASTNAANNLTFNVGTLRYTGASASTDRSFRLIGNGTLEISSAATNLTFIGASTDTGALVKTGPGTLTFAGSNAHTGGITVNGGTLVLDYTATNTSKLSDTAALTLGSGTLQLDRAAAASGTHTEIVLSTTLSGTAFVTRGAGSSAVLRMNAITRNAGSSVDFGAAAIANTDSLNTNGLLGPWATINRTDFAMNSTNAADGLINAYTAYTDVTRLSSGTKVIANGSTSNVRIIEGTGSAANITLGAATTTINSLNQSASGGTSVAVIDTAAQILRMGSLLAGSGTGALTIGTTPGSGTLTAATAGGELILLNYGSSGVTINSVIANNTSASSLTHAGTGTTVLAATNTYTGKTIISGGKLSISAETGLGSNPASLTADQLTLNGGTLLSTATFSIDDANRGVTLGASSGTFEVSTGTLTVAKTIAGAGRLTKSGVGTLTLSVSNTYSGETTVSAGTLQLNTATSAGAGTITLNDANTGSANVQLTLNPNVIDSVTNDITVANQGIGTTTIKFSSTTVNGVSSAAGTWALNRATTLDASGGFNNYFAMAHALVGSGTLTISSTNNTRLDLAGTNSAFTGDIILNSGAILEMRGEFTAATGNNVTVDPGAELRIALINSSIGGLNGAGTVQGQPGLAGATLSVGKGNASGSFSGTIQDLGDTPTSFAKIGAGTQTLAGSNTFTGTTAVSGGALVLDYTATNTSKLSDTAILTLGSATLGAATLQLDRAASATGSHTEIVLSTTIGGGVSITRGAGSTAVLRMNAITRNANTSANFGAAGIASTDTLNTNGILGPWATIAGADWAMNSTNAADGLITAYTAYTDVTRLNSGPQVIVNGSTTNVRIIEGTGAPANITLGTPVVTINTLNQSSVGGGSAVIINTASQTLAVNGILAGSGTGALAIGTAPGSGTLASATAGGELIVHNYSSNTLTLNSNIVNNPTANRFTHSGTGTTVLTGTNLYSGLTTVLSGMLAINGNNSNAMGAVSVTGTLAGIGSVGGVTTVNTTGVIRGGLVDGVNNHGTLTINANLTMAAGAGLTSSITFGTPANSKLILTAASIFNFAPGMIINLLGDGTDAAYVDYTITLLTVGTGSIQMGGVAQSGTIANPGFTNYTLSPSGFAYSVASYELLANGNQLQLHVTMAPEPHHLLLVCAAALGLGVWLRRRCNGVAVA